MATFRKRGNKWSFRIDIGRDPVTNERKQITVSKSKEYPNGFDSKTVKIAAATMQHELSHGTHVTEKEILFKELVTNWLNIYSRNVKVSTVRIRRFETAHLNRYFENMKAKNITKKMYQDMLNDLKDKDYSKSSINGIHAAGKMIFGYAMEFDFIKINPTQYAKLPKTQKTVEQIENKKEIPKYLEKEQLSLFLKTARDRGLFGDYAIFMTLAYSGIRVGELCALKETDFDFDNHTLSITKTYYNETNNATKYELLTPKTETSIRKIELDPVVFEVIQKHLTSYNEVKMFYRKSYYDKGYVFADKRRTPGYPFYIHKVEDRMERLLLLAKLDSSLTPHSLRHTHTSLLAEAGVGLQEIMERLGHKDDETTKNVYMHVTKSMKKVASQKFGELMKSI